ncbi:MAG: 2-oxo-4-hydroxy-4-carboxy-5-ureidoimidazoline decarboxylase, partial [Gemmatimonadota bacterium]|nr:2-oxo-4-hydroxy-4-carboxy-5-ureidoimidazoline decarboxylase [Gemmatimonadota bacterium]
PDLGEGLDELAPDARARALRRCCAAGRWVSRMAGRAPFGDETSVFRAADEIGRALGPEDLLEAIASHPRIGARELTERWSAEEQSGVAGASPETLEALDRANEAYEERFGFRFLICASGLGAEAMLEALDRRLENDRETELRVAAAEQAAITRLRLARLTEEV